MALQPSPDKVSGYRKVHINDVSLGQIGSVNSDQLNASTTAKVDTSSLTPSARGSWAEVAAGFKGQPEFDFIPSSAIGDEGRILNQVLELAKQRQHEVASKQWKFTRCSGKVVYVRDIYEHVATCVQKFKTVGDIATQADAGAASLPWAGIRLLLQAVINENERHQAMLEGIELVSDLVVRGAIIEDLYLPVDTITPAPAAQLHNALLKVYSRIMRFLLDAVHHYSRNSIKRFGKSIFNPVETTLQRRIADIARDQAVVDNLAHYVQRQWSIEWHGQISEAAATLQEMLKSTQNRIEEIRLGLSLLVRRDQQLQDTKYLDWLSPIPSAQHHADVRMDRLRRTGQWLMQTRQFLDWIQSTESALLWLHGPPGCGKSRLISAVIDQIRETEVRPDESLSVAYIYFARDTAEKQRGDPSEALRSIARQICLSTSQLELLKDRYSQQKAIYCAPDVPPKLCMDEVLDFVRGMIIDGTAYLIVDAMDECEGSKRDDMIRSLDTVLNMGDIKVRLLVSSRDPPPKRLSRCSAFEIFPEDNLEDIDRFIDSKFAEYIVEGRLLQGHVSDELKFQIVDTLKAKAQGMFLWCSLQLENLSDANRMIMEEDVSEELECLPPLLDDLYASAFDQILKAGLTSRHVAMTTLKWLLYAQHPLTTTELVAAVTVDHEQKIISVSLEQVVSSCRNLVVHDKKLDVLRFAHLSVRDYLEKQDEFGIFETEALLAERCLDVISATLSGLENIKGQKLPQNLALQDYASVFWASHYKNIGHGKAPSRLERRLILFFARGDEDVNAFKRWTLAIPATLDRIGQLDPSIKHDLLQLSHPPTSPLAAACILGLTKVLTYFRRRYPEQCITPVIGGRSLIELAAENGHFEIVELLLEPQTALENPNPLPLTKIKEHVDSNPKFVYYVAALQAAIASARGEVIIILVKQGKQLNEDVKLLDYALESAAWLEDQKMVTTLLHHGAEVTNPRPGRHWDILSQAVQCGMRDLVEHLLDNGADVHAVSRDGRDYSPIEYAAKHGQARIAQLLMDRGASLITRSMTDNCTVFQYPAQNDDVETLQVLWDGTVREGKHDPWTVLNLQDRFRAENPLHRAVRHRAINAARWLCDHHVEMSLNFQGFTPFDHAISDKNLDLVRIILSAAYIDESVILGRGLRGNLPPLAYAASKGNVEICIEILQHFPGAIYTLTNLEHTPLHGAAMRGHLETLEALLLSPYANRVLNAQNRWQMTPLMEAIANGYPEAVKVLLLHGANLTIAMVGRFLGADYDNYSPFTGASFTSLHTAVAWQRHGILTILLQDGSKRLSNHDFRQWVAARDSWQRTAMDLAMDLGDKSLVGSLTAVSQDVPTEDRAGMRERSRLRRRYAVRNQPLDWARKDLHAATRPCLLQNAELSQMLEFVTDNTIEKWLSFLTEAEVDQDRIANSSVLGGGKTPRFD